MGIFHKPEKNMISHRKIETVFTYLERIDEIKFNYGKNIVWRKNIINKPKDKNFDPKRVGHNSLV